MAKSIFVFNNLTNEQIAMLDADYPDLDAVEAMVRASVEKGANFAVRAEENGGYVVFCNQGEYATTGRSTSPLDALVIALFKHHLCGYDLSRAEGAEKKNRRG